MDTVYVLLVSKTSDEPNEVLMTFTSEKSAEEFISIQKGIYFPYKSYEIVESDFY